MTRGMLEEFLRQLQAGSQSALIFGTLAVLLLIGAAVWVTRK